MKQQTPSVAILVFVLILVSGFANNQTLTGYDTRSHVAKVFFLLYSIQRLNFTGWSWFWYCGAPIFDTYSPLFYIVAAAFSLPFGGNALLGTKVAIIVSFLLSAVLMYQLCLSLTKNRACSIIGAFCYTAAPSHFLFLTDFGSLTYSFAYIFLPLIFLYLEKALQHCFKKSVVAGFGFALLVLSNWPTAYGLSILLVAYLAFRLLLFPERKEAFRILMIVGAIGIGCSAIWWVPYLSYSAFLPLLAAPSRLVESLTLTDILTPNFTDHWRGYIGNFILIPGLLAAAMARRRIPVLYTLLALVSILLTIGGKSDIYYLLPFISAMQSSKRFVIFDVFFLSILTAFFWSELQGKLHGVPRYSMFLGKTRTLLSASVIVALLIGSSILGVPIRDFGRMTGYYPVEISAGEFDAMRFLAGQPGFFRVMSYDRWHSWFPMYCSKGSVDGWYDQAFPKIMREYTFHVYYASKGVDLNQKPLSILGVRYVLTYYGYNDEGRAALKMYNSSVFSPPIYMNSEIAIFENPAWRLIWVAGTAYMIEENDEKREADIFYNLTTDAQYDPQAVVILRGKVANNLTGVPAKTYSSGMNLEGEKVGYQVLRSSFEETRIEVTVKVDRSCFVYFSSSYFPGWTAKVNSKPWKLLIGEPNFLCVYLPKSGTYLIQLSYGIGSLKIYPAFTSTILVFLLVVAYFCYSTQRSSRSRIKKRSEE